MEINIRYLVPGIITVDIPEEILKKSKEEIRNWALDALAEKTNKELLEGLETVAYNGEPIENRIFDEVPWVEAIEKKETLETILQTKVWEEFLAGDEIIDNEKEKL